MSATVPELAFVMAPRQNLFFVEIVAAIRDELDRLGVDSVALLGGQRALSAGVEEDLAAAGVATRRPLLALAAAAPYLRHRARGGARWLPVHVAIDATEIATAVAGSVRHRTLML